LAVRRKTIGGRELHPRLDWQRLGECGVARSATRRRQRGAAGQKQTAMEEPISRDAFNVVRGLRILASHFDLALPRTPAAFQSARMRRSRRARKMDIEFRNREPMRRWTVITGRPLRMYAAFIDSLNSNSYRNVMASTDNDPRHHTQKMQKRLQEIIDHLRLDIEKVDEPQLKAMFETSAEVLGGLVKAFKDYEQKNERAWR
jgi:hypothetical protein